MVSLWVRVSGSLETAQATMSSGPMAGITLSGQRDAMEKISFGVSHLVGQGVDDLLRSMAANAILSTGRLLVQLYYLCTKIHPSLCDLQWTKFTTTCAATVLLVQQLYYLCSNCTTCAATVLLVHKDPFFV